MRRVQSVTKYCWFWPGNFRPARYQQAVLQCDLSMVRLLREREMMTFFSAQFHLSRISPSACTPNKWCFMDCSCDIDRLDNDENPLFKRNTLSLSISLFIYVCVFFFTRVRVAKQGKRHYFHPKNEHHSAIVMAIDFGVLLSICSLITT